MNNRWELYEIENHEKINSLLDKRFNKLIGVAKIKIQNGEDPIDSGSNVRKKMDFMMQSIEGFGASDTEPRKILITSICEELGLPLNKEAINKLQ